MRTVAISLDIEVWRRNRPFFKKKIILCIFKIKIRHGNSEVRLLGFYFVFGKFGAVRMLDSYSAQVGSIQAFAENKTPRGQIESLL